MTNFLTYLPVKTQAFLACLVAVVMLQGCGAARDTPFSPASSSSSCSSSTSSSSSSSASSSSSSSCSSSSSSSSSSSLSSSNSPSSSSSSVQLVQLWSATNTITAVEPSGKNARAISTAAEFNKEISNYMDPLLLGSTDYFTDGQVILIYDGEVNNCVAHLEFNNSISASDVSNVSVKVTLGYLERPSSDKCSPSISHPFSLYQIKTKKLVTFEEKIE